MFDFDMDVGKLRKPFFVDVSFLILFGEREVTFLGFILSDPGR